MDSLTGERSQAVSLTTGLGDSSTRISVDRFPKDSADLQKER